MAITSRPQQPGPKLGTFIGTIFCLLGSLTFFTVNGQSFAPAITASGPTTFCGCGSVRLSGPNKIQGTILTTLAGNNAPEFAYGNTTNTEFYYPSGIALDTAGNLYVADTYNHLIRKIDRFGKLTNLAGDGTSGFADGPTLKAKFSFPSGLATDLAGNVYVADRSNHSIRKIDKVGFVTTLAGNGKQGYANGSRAFSKFSYPNSLATDRAGNVYVADQNNHRIRKIDRLGMVSTLAGSGEAGFSDGIGGLAKFSFPAGVATDSAGNVYVADQMNNRIRKIDALGNVSTLAGTGNKGFADGEGAISKFYYPSGVATDIYGFVYVADQNNHRIRKIDMAGNVVTLAGNGKTGIANGKAESGEFNGPVSLIIDSKSTVYVADYYNNAIRKITQNQNFDSYLWSTGDTTQSIIVAKTGNYYLQTISGGEKSKPTLQNVTVAEHIVIPITALLCPNEIFVFKRKIYINSGIYTETTHTKNGCDTVWQLNLTILEVKQNVCKTDNVVQCKGGVVDLGKAEKKAKATVRVFSGTGKASFKDGKWDSAYYYNPTKMVTGQDGYFYLIDEGYNCVRKIDQSGSVVTVAGYGFGQDYNETGTPVEIGKLKEITIDAKGVIYVTDALLGRIYTIEQNATAASIVAKNLNFPRVKDGLLVVADSLPFSINGITIDKAGNFYISSGHCIRKIKRDGTFTTFSGSGTRGYEDGHPAAAQFDSPGSLAIDGAGNLFLADVGNNCIRKIDPKGNVTTFAGDPMRGFADGNGKEARFNSPRSLKLDSKGNIYVADFYNNAIRRIDKDGNVTTIVGEPSEGLSDGVGVFEPFDVTIDKEGGIYIVEYANNRILKVL